MNADLKHLKLDAVTSKVIASAYRVSNELGAGFLEKVYENALAVELRRTQLRFTQQSAYTVRYREQIVGEYIPDFVVADSVVLEVKALDDLSPRHESQCLNYLRVTGLPVALLFNFGKPRLQFKRVVWRF